MPPSAGAGRLGLLGAVAGEQLRRLSVPWGRWRTWGSFTKMTIGVLYGYYVVIQ